MTIAERREKTKKKRKLRSHVIAGENLKRQLCGVS